ncbi:hypothetical protein FRC12_023995 [Ceratobasidium sp. 428]|nr:hypothetical protein FRC12_023995 [Ceratobasidium sp. 428]
MSVHGDDDLYADLYGNDDYNTAEDEILGTKPTSGKKTDTALAEATQTPSVTEKISNKSETQAPASATAAPKLFEAAPEPVRAAPAPPPQIGSSIATYTSDEGTTLPPTSYSNGYSSLPPSMRPYDPEAEKQYPKPSSNDFGDSTQGDSPAGGYNGQSDSAGYQQKQGGYANGAVFESSTQGGYGGQRGAYGNYSGGGPGGGRRFDSVRPSEMKDEGKMFVGGLNWDTTDESLRSYFSEFGKVDACTIMRDASGRSRGFAFLTFEDPAAVNAVMVREHYLDGKIVSSQLCGER